MEELVVHGDSEDDAETDDAETSRQGMLNNMVVGFFNFLPDPGYALC